MQNQQINNILMLAQNMGLIDLAMQGYNAYKNGKLDIFVNYHYANNKEFKDFFDKNKNKTFEQFLKDKGINVE